MFNLTLNDLSNLERHPDSKSCIIEYKAKAMGQFEDYESFVKRINSEIDNIIQMLESSRDYYNKLSEDAITNTICMMLKQKSINASHGQYQSGETDLTVKHGPNLWIGEAKWWGQDESAFEGMRQLSTRYATGGDNANSGGVLLYNKTSNLRQKFDRLKGLYSGKSDEFHEIEVNVCTASNFAFHTEHTSQTSGDRYKVRHIVLNLHHAPQDKSARNRVK